jgi:hypothetical protein
MQLSKARALALDYLQGTGCCGSISKSGGIDDS